MIIEETGFKRICGPKVNNWGKYLILFVREEWGRMVKSIDVFKHSLSRQLFWDVIENKWKDFLIIIFCCLKSQKIVFYNLKKIDSSLFQIFGISVT